MRAVFIVAIGVVAVIAVIACGEDDPLANPVPTVPTVSTTVPDETMSYDTTSTNTTGGTSNETTSSANSANEADRSETDIARGETTTTNPNDENETAPSANDEDETDRTQTGISGDDTTTTNPNDENEAASSANDEGEADRSETDIADNATTTTNPSHDDNQGDVGDSHSSELTITTVVGDINRVAVDVEVVITLDQPIDMTTVPGDELAWVAERSGRVLRVDLDRGEVVEVVLDISDETTTDSERGLLGIVATDGWLYANYTNRSGHTQVEAFERSGSGLSGNRRTILVQEQPYPTHNGGELQIGPDGYLYIGFGDGGSAGDPLDNGQDPFTWLGSLLRIEPTPESDQPYAIPPDNPFADGAEGRPEIFLTGVRNPWRFSFDKITGDLWVSDVGQYSFEEVTLLLAANDGGAGANLGWRLREGLHRYSGEPPANHVDPVWEYGHDKGCAVTGGYVYRGSVIDDLPGAYVFGDVCESRLWAVSLAGGIVAFRDLGVAVPGADLVAFGQDMDGELYTLSLTGPVSRIVAG